MSKKTINAVLVKLAISVFPNSRQDRGITEDVKAQKALGTGAGKWVKYKLPDECLDKIRKFCNEVRAFHYDYTSPWETGYRLLNEKVHAKYEARMNEFSQKFWALVDEFGAEYDAWIDKAKIMHADTFDHTDYPTWQNCRLMFAFGREFYPIPQPDHFNAEMKGVYGAGLEAITEKKINDAIADTWERLFKPVQKMAEKLSSPDAIFRDSLVENIKEITAIVPELNLTNDETLAKAVEEIKTQLAGLNIETLKTDKVERQDAAEKAKALLERFGAMGNRKLAA